MLPAGPRTPRGRDTGRSPSTARSCRSPCRPSTPRPSAHPPRRPWPGSAGPRRGPAHRPRGPRASSARSSASSARSLASSAQVLDEVVAGRRAREEQPPPRPHRAPRCARPRPAPAPIACAPTSRTARSAASPDVLTESRTAWPQPASNRAATAVAATALLVISNHPSRIFTRKPRRGVSALHPWAAISATTRVLLQIRATLVDAAGSCTCPLPTTVRRATCKTAGPAAQAMPQGGGSLPVCGRSAGPRPGEPTAPTVSPERSTVSAVARWSCRRRGRAAARHPSVRRDRRTPPDRRERGRSAAGRLRP